MPEIIHHCAKTPLLLAGTQTDLRDDPSPTEKLSEQIEAYHSRDRLKAIEYVECFELIQKGLKNVFDDAILAAPQQGTRGRAAGVCCCERLARALSPQLASAPY